MKKLNASIGFIFILMVIGLSTSFSQVKTTYDYKFNPVLGKVNEIEKDFREEICLNGSWDFMPIPQAKPTDFNYPDQFRKDPVAIKIPSPWNVNHFTNGKGGDFVTYPGYPKEWEKVEMAWMKKKVNIPLDWKEKRTVLHFEGVMGKTKIYVNGKLAAENFELFLPFEADISAFIKAGQENDITVGVAKGSLFDDRGKYGRRTYVGGSMWGIEMAGIWQDVYLFGYHPVYVQGVFVKPDVASKTLAVEIEINNTTGKDKLLSIDGAVKKWFNLAGHTISASPEEKSTLAKQASLLIPAQQVKAKAGAVTKITLSAKVSAGQLEYWTPDHPNLYGLVLNLTTGNQVIDKKYTRFGWRQFTISKDNLLLNGEKISLKGDSWHFMGVPQMTRRYAWSWFNMLKDANANAVRFHAQPFPSFYLDVADEMGICVLDETGIWSSDGGPKIDSEAYWESCKTHLSRLIKRDRNHASVFGWSVCNETVPVAVHVFKAPESLVQKQLDEINGWVKLTSELDPTRPWISGDGETDRPTNLPVIIGHYGGQEGMKKWASEGKPWGIGEQSMAYYGTPKQASVYNGDRAYESMQQRMEAIALESYDLIKTQRALNASYSSVFNIAWYALQPLELGMKDTSRPPLPTDGIFFTDYKEGVPGMQPERLGPYTSTLNPGYDPALPLYRTWPMFDAIRRANANPVLQFTIPTATEKKADRAVIPADAVVLFAAPGSPLKENLESIGIRLSVDQKINHKTLVIIDAKSPDFAKDIRAKVKAAVGIGARVIIFGANPKTEGLLNDILPYPLKFEARKASSFIKEGEPLVLQGLNNADFYFSELMTKDQTGMEYGLAGDFAMKAMVLLKASNTNWQAWNYQSETSKTGAVLRTERETKGSGIVMAALPVGSTEIIASTLKLDDIAIETRGLLTKMLSNLGAVVSNENIKDMQALDGHARLRKALVLGTLSKGKAEVKELLNTDYLKGEASLKPVLNTSSADQSWQVVNSGVHGDFVLAKSERDRYPVSYLSFWVYSPRSLSNLLAEPDMPSLDLFVKTDAGFVTYLNGNKLGAQDGKVANLMLDKGWNHLMLKLVQPNTETAIKTMIHFESADKGFMKQLLSAVVK